MHAFNSHVLYRIVLNVIRHITIHAILKIIQNL